MATHRSRRRRSKKTEEAAYDYSKLDRKVFQDLGKRTKIQDFEVIAGERAYVAKAWLPILLTIARAATGVSLLSFLASIWFIVNWPSPTLLLSFPDGTVRCAPAPLNPTTGLQKPRNSAREARLCAALENYGGNRDTGGDQ